VHKKANDIVYVANGLVGVRYRKQGRNQFGLDCAGLVIVIAHLLDITDKDTTAYSDRPNVQEFTKFMLDTGCRQLPYGRHEHGDILRLNSQGWPVHLGVYEIDERGDEWYIHAYAPHRKVTRDPLTPEVKKKISSVWRFPEDHN
jgi:cell wall-associated NlpC family hydrolase